MKRKTLTKGALVLSMILIVLWCALGTTSSIAWFKDEDTIVNMLHFGNIDIDMYYKEAGQYKSIDGSTEVFDDGILYEPGYTRVVYLKITNAGSIPFNYDLSVVPDLASTVLGTSVLGNKIDLADYIKFGLVVCSTEEEVEKQTADRETAKSLATHSLSNYSGEGGSLSSGSSDYAALIIYFPEEVGNVANYIGDTAPEIGLGLAAIANQSN